MATYIRGAAVPNATHYELLEKSIDRGSESEAPNVFDIDIVNQYYRNGCFLAASAKWYSVVSFISTTLLPLVREGSNPAVLYIYNVKSTAEMHLTWWGEEAVEEAPTADVVGTGNVFPAGGFTVKNGTNVGSGNTTLEWTTDSKGTECFKLTVANKYNPTAKYIRLGIGTNSFATGNRSDVYICAGERYQYTGGTGEVTYDTITTSDEINFNISELGNSMVTGSHTFVVRAMADNFKSSDYSNEVVYTVS